MGCNDAPDWSFMRTAKRDAELIAKAKRVMTETPSESTAHLYVSKAQYDAKVLS